jgi:hypothetical protein
MLRISTASIITPGTTTTHGFFIVVRAAIVARWGVMIGTLTNMGGGLDFK